MMSTSSHSKAENGVIQSSIGLLQERFRQLQRVKETRENKELFRMFSDYNNNTRNTNTNTNTSSTNNVSPIIVCNTSYTTSTITSTTTISTGSPINNMNSNVDNKNISDSTVQYDNDDNDRLQIFIPPNYSSLNNPKSSCYSPSATISSNMTINPSTDVSLSLWSYNNSAPATTYPFRRENSDNLLSTMNMQRPVAVSRPSTTCVSTFSNKMEDPRHVTDVDTTLHL